MVITSRCTIHRTQTGWAAVVDRGGGEGPHDEDHGTDRTLMSRSLTMLAYQIHDRKFRDQVYCALWLSLGYLYMCRSVKSRMQSIVNRQLDTLQWVPGVRIGIIITYMM